MLFLQIYSINLHLNFAIPQHRIEHMLIFAASQLSICPERSAAERFPQVQFQTDLRR